MESKFINIVMYSDSIVLTNQILIQIIIKGLDIEIKNPLLEPFTSSAFFRSLLAIYTFIFIIRRELLPWASNGLQLRPRAPRVACY